MQEFSLRGVCNTIIKEFNQGITNGNIMRIRMDIELPDAVVGDLSSFRNTIETVSSFLSHHLVNGIITLTLSGKATGENTIGLLLTFFARDSNDTFQASDIGKKSAVETDLARICTELNMDVKLKITDLGMQVTLRKTLHEPLPPATQNLHPLAGRCILLAEDNEINAMVFISFMEEWGIQTTHVPDGLAAVHQAGKMFFDLILMDINMPVMNGIEAIHAIRKMDLELPILVLTASTMEQDISHALAAGADGYIQKPVSSTQLLSLLSHHLT